MVLAAEQVISAHPAVINVFAFAGEGGLNQNNGGAQAPADTVGRVQFEIIPWEDRPNISEPVLGGLFDHNVVAPDYDGDFVIDQLNVELAQIPGIEILPLEQGPASAKPVHLRIKGDNWEELTSSTNTARSAFDATPGLIKIEDTLPLPGIDWQIDVDVAKAGRFGADVATVGAMVQLVTRGILLGEMRPDTQMRKSRSVYACPKMTGYCRHLIRSKYARQTVWCRCRTSSPASRWPNWLRSTG